MPFTGIATNERFTASGIGEDLSPLVRVLSPKATPFLTWLGDAGVSARNIKHEWWDEYALPNTILTSTAINSTAGADISIAINGLGNALTIGTVLRPGAGAAEFFQVKSIIGADSITLLRGYNGTAGAGSLAVGGTLYVTQPGGVEGADHSGADTRRLGTRVANTVELFRYEIAESMTSLETNNLGANGWDARVEKAMKASLYALENAVVRGVLNTSAGSLGSATAGRTMKGLDGFISAINSTVAVASFSANAHTYLGDAWRNIFNAGGEANTETWGIVAGAQVYQYLSNLNDTKVEDTSDVEEFKRVIRRYTGAFGTAELFLGRTLDTDRWIMVPRERVQVVPLSGRTFTYTPMAVSGDNRKALITGEYTVEVYHPSAMAKGYVNG
jgi:hypothetical protein